MVEKQFEFCVIDAEGDYHGLAHAVCVGDGSMPPAAEDALTLLQKTGVNVVINTLALKLPERQQLFAKLLSPISDLRGENRPPAITRAG